MLESDLKQAVIRELLTLSDSEVARVTPILQNEGEDASILRLMKTGTPSIITVNNLASLVNALAAVGRVATYVGENAFQLYDTFGLPRDFIEDACRDAGISFDASGFDNAMAEQRRRAQASWKGTQNNLPAAFMSMPNQQFLRDTGKTQVSQLQNYVRRAGWAERAGHEGWRELRMSSSTTRRSTRKQADRLAIKAGSTADQITKLWLRRCSAVTSLCKGCAHIASSRRHVLVGGDFVDAVVDEEVRAATMRNHTGTHLLHAALRNVLGTHVKQAGSLVDPGHLRFDFSHFASLDDEELQDIEDLANREVLRNDRVEVIEDVPIDVAVNEYHAMALFGEKYGDRVRVIRIGDFSTELCGGTHTGATGEIGLIKILKEGSVSSGVRRLEAVTGEGSLRHFRKDHQLENVVSTLVRVDEESPAEALKRELERREEELKKLRKELEQARMKSAASSVSSATENVREVKGVKVLATRADNLERTQLRTLVDNLRNKLGSGVVVMGSVSDGQGRA